MKARLDVFQNESANKRIEFIVKNKSGEYHEIYLQPINLEDYRGIKIPANFYIKSLPIFNSSCRISDFMQTSRAGRRHAGYSKIYYKYACLIIDIKLNRICIERTPLFILL
jgi:hypothetical protein